MSNHPFILIIEDNALNLKLCRVLLASSKYCVRDAPDAETGLQIISRCAPDLVLMDIGLPGISGIEATRRIRQVHRRRDLPVVALTSHAMMGDRAEAMEAGCTGYLTKPIDTRRFRSQIAGFLEDKTWPVRRVTRVSCATRGA